MKNKLFVKMAILMLPILMGCSSESTDAFQEKVQDHISISLLDSCDITEGSYSMSNEVFNCTLEQWKQEHPEIIIQENRVSPDEYFIDIASYATIDRGLPDVFILPAELIHDWSSRGLLLDITDVMETSEWNDFCYQDTLQPYTSKEKVYGFPLSNKSYSIIVYDKSLWSSLGYHDFPDNWNDIILAKDQIYNLGYDCVIGVDSANYLLSFLVYQNCGREWFENIVAMEPSAMFTDEEFTTSLTTLKQLFDSGIFPSDFSTGDRSLMRFINRQCPAAIISTDSVYELQQTMLATDPERYSQLGFVLIPAISDSSDDSLCNPYTTCYGISNALVINAKVEEDPERKEACIEFCKFMTGITYADNMKEAFGFQSFTHSNSEYKGSDSIWSQLLECIYGSQESAEDNSSVIYYPNIELFLGNGTWISVNSTLGEWLSTSKYTSEEVANYIQDEYEKYYLPTDILNMEGLLFFF